MTYTTQKAHSFSSPLLHTICLDTDLRGRSPTAALECCCLCGGSAAKLAVTDTSHSDSKENEIPTPIKLTSIYYFPGLPRAFFSKVNSGWLKIFFPNITDAITSGTELSKSDTFQSKT